MRLLKKTSWSEYEGNPQRGKKDLNIKYDKRLVSKLYKEAYTNQREKYSLALKKWMKCLDTSKRGYLKDIKTMTVCPNLLSGNANWNHDETSLHTG